MPRRPVKRAPKVYEQPLRSIMTRFSDYAGPWVVLECEHVEPGRGLDLANAARCKQCNPVRRGSPTAIGMHTTDTAPRAIGRPIPDFAYDPNT